MKYYLNQITILRKTDHFIKKMVILHTRGRLARDIHGISFPGIKLINKNIGNINLGKIDYYCKYLAIYSEEEISKITKISVEQLK